MKNKKYLLMVIIILILVGVKSMPVIKSWSQMKSLEKSITSFIEFLENENVEALSLRVYVETVFSLHQPIRNVRELETSARAERIATVDGSILSQHIELFKEIENTSLVPARGRYETIAVLYYVFETENDGILLEVGMSAFRTPPFLIDTLVHFLEDVFDRAFYDEARYVIINGVAVEDNQIFLDIILPFLPEDAAQWLSGNN